MLSSMISVCLDSKSAFPSCVLFLFFFFFLCFHTFWSIAVTVQWTVTANVDFLQWTVHICTVYGPTNFILLSIFSLKMGPTSLFTHLKIILLQCFHFSVFSFSKISSIQTHLYSAAVMFGVAKHSSPSVLHLLFLMYNSISFL